MVSQKPVHGVVIVGGGQAGHQTAESLRNEGYIGPIRILCAEQHLPYQQPPLSKGFLKEEVGEDRLPFRNSVFFADKNIDLLFGETATGLDVVEKTVTTTTQTYSYDKLVIATGSTPRTLPVAGGDLDGILTLRTLDDAKDLHRRLKAARNLVIVGAGFIGLEVASTALHLGLKVTVVEAMDRVMARVVSPPISSFFQQAHTAQGLNLRLNTMFDHFEGRDGRVSQVVLKDGSQIDADLVLLGIGATANDAIAKDAGLDVANGVVVNAQMQTNDPDVYAIGDCSYHPNAFWGGMFRLESVQNAIDQAKVVAAHIQGKDVHYNAVPWFWSDQQGFKLQMVGLPKPGADLMLIGDEIEGAFAMLHFEGDRLTGVETVNQPAEQMAARQLLVAEKPVTRAEVEAAGALKIVLKKRRQAAR